MAEDLIQEVQQPVPPVTTTWHVPHFHIQGLMWVIAFIALGFALYRWLGPLLTIFILVFPSSLLVERLFGASPWVAETPGSLSGFVARTAAVVFCGCLCSTVAWYGSSQGVPTILAPMPLFVTAVIFSMPQTLGLNAWIFVAAFASGTFVLMNSYQLRWSSCSILPIRFPVLLVIATAFSVCFFAFDWEYGVRFQGAFYTLTSAAINTLFLLVLWAWWLAIRRRASVAGALGFATVFHCWLFWFAFPYLGELP
jgi:hypothetical protein